ncbi:pyridoxamine 5'-phosphate oxidase family protein [Kitasatospora sp. NPDC057223]|uniref:pyridoxamine 5'-phosphate oxidase family protein n=1 Tax=Kitasatospora sp. NPDC057223 TaxID=3346055 RepID=UPI0036408F79
MATWQDFEHEAPDLAPAVRARFEANKHHVLATLRRDGSPRVSGTEVQFIGADLTIGSMYGAVKARDLQRDARYALHSNPGDSSMAGGDAKIAGHAVEITDAVELTAYESELPEPPPPGPFHAFRMELDQVVLTTLEGDHLLVRSWRPGEPVKTVQRH